MTTAEEAKKQILRLAESGFVPVPTAQLEIELIAVFCELCVGAGHVQRVGDWLMRNTTYFPKPKDVQDAVNALIELAKQPAEWSPRDHRNECETCGVTSWMQVWELHTYHGTVSNKTVERVSETQYRELLKRVDGRIGTGQVAIEAADRCTACALGRRMRDDDRTPPEDPGASRERRSKQESVAKQMGLNVVPIRGME